VRWSSGFVYWVVAGVVMVAVAILLLAEGYWYSIFGTLPLAALSAYFARKEWDKLDAR
jgi:uncharacterized membrane protein